jgi:eukaryotic-like serine/threonine-protein kinase
MTDETNEAMSAAKARIGRVLKEKWTLDGLLGVGGMAAVYAGTHRNKRRGAVKILHSELSADPIMRKRFLREGYVANSVGHRGAVEVYDDDVAEDGSAFLVMELLEGETLEARWARKGSKLPPLEVLALMDQLLDTLAEAHARDIVHRDLKPENLFLTSDGVVKVLDFGIARLRETGQASAATQTGNAMGTPAFMAPEQARGRWDEVNGRTDLWAVGASMFTLLTGVYVHGTGTVNEILARAITQPTPPIASVDPSLDPQLAAFVDKALAYEKSQRFADAGEMQAELRVLYHRLVGDAEMRAAQPPLAGGATEAAVPVGEVFDPASVPLRNQATAGESDGVRAGSNATLTTGRGVATTGSANFALSRKKWVPLAAAGTAISLFGFALHARRGTSADPPTAAVAAAAPSNSMSTKTAPAAAPVVVPTDTLAPTTPTAVDVTSLPVLGKQAQPSAAEKANGPKDGVSTSKLDGAFPAAARGPEKAPSVVQKAPPLTPARTAPAELFRKRR